MALRGVRKGKIRVSWGEVPNPAWEGASLKDLGSYCEGEVSFFFLKCRTSFLNITKGHENMWDDNLCSCRIIEKTRCVHRDVSGSDHPLLFLPSVFPCIRVFSNELALPIRWTKYWSFSFSISPSNEYSRLISFRIDWLDLLPVQGTLKSLLQHHSSKASILQHSAFFIVQLSHLCMTTGKKP